jgi:uncharacterized protein YlxW (UPF0749 family)
MTSRRDVKTIALLVDLVTDSADPGYAAAAARRRAGGPESAGRRWFDRPAVALGCALIGLTLAIAYVHTHRAAPAAAKVHAGLVARVQAAKAAGDSLDAKAQRLNADVGRLHAQALPGTSIGAELSQTELLAAATPVTGPGLRVQLADPPAKSATPDSGRRGTTPIGSSQILTDRDVRSVVNELWYDGAEAISINDVRMSPTSAIRFAGQAVLVDFAPVTSPYTIRAIGDSDVLVTSFADSDVASRYHTLASADGITFSWSQESKLQLPASTTTTPRYARPEPAATGRSR